MFLFPHVSFIFCHSLSILHFDLLSSCSKTAEVMTLMLKMGNIHSHCCMRWRVNPLHWSEVKLAAISQEVRNSSVSRARESSYRDVSVHISLCVSFLLNITHISQSQPGQVIWQRRRMEESALLSSYIWLVHFGWNWCCIHTPEAASLSNSIHNCAQSLA